MERDLTELSKDYFKAAEDISCLIAKYRKLLNEAYEANNHLKTYEIKRKLTIFYDQKRDVVETAYALLNYYDKNRRMVLV